MKVSYPDSIDVFNLSPSRDSRNTSQLSTRFTLEDIPYILQELESRVGALDLSDDSSHEYRITSIEAQIASGSIVGTSSTSFSGSASDVTMERIGNSTYSTVQHLQDIFHSAGWSSGGTIADAGSGNITVTAGTGFIRATASRNATVYYFDWSALGSTAITSNSIRYVGVEYNGGSPQVVVRATYNWNFTTDFPLGSVVNESGTLHILNSPHAVGDHANFMIQRAYATMPMSRGLRGSGLNLGETGTRNVTVSYGEIWERLEKFAIAAIDTSVSDTFDRYYRNGAGDWTKQSAQTQWNNTQYDDSDGTLGTITNNWYSCQYFYIELDGNLVSLFGWNQYSTLQSAREDSPPTIVPKRLQAHGKLIGRIIFRQGQSTAEEVQSVFDVQFTASSVVSLDEIAPTTTKGDIIVHNGSNNVRLAVGVNGKVLKANSATSEGIEWADESGGASHNLLSSTHSDTVTSTPVRGDIIVAVIGATWDNLAIGTVGKYLRSNGTDPSWQTIAYSDISGTPNVITELNGLSGGAQTFSDVDDTNVTLAITSATSNHEFTLGWTGTLAAPRLNSNVVQTVSSDTNVTGSILTQNLTLGWTGTLASSRGGTGNAFFAVSGPATSTKTFTFPNATCTVLTTNATVSVTQGGTGQTTYTNGQLLIGNTTGNTLTKATLTQGTGVTITNGTGSITVAIGQAVETTSNVRFGTVTIGASPSTYTLRIAGSSSTDLNAILLDRDLTTNVSILSQVNFNADLTGGAGTGYIYGLRIDNTMNGTSALAEVAGIRNYPTVNKSAGTITDLIGFVHQGMVLTSGTVTTQTAFWCKSTGTGTNVRAFRGSVVASGSARYNLYMDGTAPNYLEGNLSIGVATAQSILTIGGAGKQQVTRSVTDGFLQVNGGQGETTGAYIQLGGSTVSGSPGVRSAEFVIGNSNTGVDNDHSKFVLYSYNGLTGGSAVWTQRFRINGYDGYAKFANYVGFNMTGSLNPTTHIHVNGNKIRIQTAKVPASAGDTGDAGDICWGRDGTTLYLYICRDTNTWERVALATW